MPTGTKIIERALKQISASSPMNPAHPETLQDAFETLNSFLDELLDGGIDFGQVLLEAPDDELNIVLAAENMLVYNLAVLMAPENNTGREVLTQNLMKRAVDTLATITRRYRKFTILPSKVSSTAVLGSGNRVGGFFSDEDDNFFGQDRELGN